MLDLFEFIGLDFCKIDNGMSMKLQQKVFPATKPQSLCAYVLENKWWLLVFIIGYYHCTKSHQRYY